LKKVAVANTKVTRYAEQQLLREAVKKLQDRKRKIEANSTLEKIFKGTV
jgi:hypothetical protein